MPRSELIGYVRRNKDGTAILLSLSMEAIKESEKYDSADGREYVGLIINLERLVDVARGGREVTSVCQLTD